MNTYKREIGAFGSNADFRLPIGTSAIEAGEAHLILVRGSRVGSFAATPSSDQILGLCGFDSLQPRNTTARGDEEIAPLAGEAGEAGHALQDLARLQVQPCGGFGNLK